MENQKEEFFNEAEMVNFITIAGWILGEDWNATLEPGERLNCLGSIGVSRINDMMLQEPR